MDDTDEHCTAGRRRRRVKAKAVKPKLKKPVKPKPKQKQKQKQSQRVTVNVGTAAPRRRRKGSKRAPAAPSYGGGARYGPIVIPVPALQPQERAIPARAVGGAVGPPENVPLGHEHVPARLPQQQQQQQLVRRQHGPPPGQAPAANFNRRPAGPPPRAASEFEQSLTNLVLSAQHDLRQMRSPPAAASQRGTRGAFNQWLRVAAGAARLANQQAAQRLSESAHVTPLRTPQSRATLSSSRSRNAAPSPAFASPAASPVPFHTPPAGAQTASPADVDRLMQRRHEPRMSIDADIYGQAAPAARGLFFPSAPSLAPAALPANVTARSRQRERVMRNVQSMLDKDQV
jgi:hypothetical protein